MMSLLPGHVASCESPISSKHVRAGQVEVLAHQHKVHLRLVDQVGFGEQLGSSAFVTRSFPLPCAMPYGKAPSHMPAQDAAP